MAPRGAKWNLASKDAQTFKQRIIVGYISMESSAKAVKEANADILGKYSVKQVENAMIRMSELELGKILENQTSQVKVDCFIVDRCFVVAVFLEFWAKFNHNKISLRTQYY